MSDLRVNSAPVGSIGNAITPANTPKLDQTQAQLFKEALSKAQKAGPEQAKPAQSLKFSNHAVDRMQARGIRFSPEEMNRIQGAVTKAQAKGAKDCLLISDQAAMIVSLKDNTVVTVMDKNNLKENVFTNIDSTVMI